MPVPSTLQGDHHFQGNVSFGGQVSLPDGTVDDDDVAPNARIKATKLEHRHAVTYRQTTGADVAAQTEDVFTARAAGAVVSVDVVATTAPAGGDKAFTVDVQKGNQSTGFATILSAVVTVDQTKASRQVVPGLLAGAATLADGDTLRVVVATSGTTGTQGQGLVVTINVDEAAQ